MSLERLVSQSFLTKWHLMVVFFDISKVCDAAWQHGILQTDTLESKGSFTNFCDVILCLIEDSESGLACISMVFLRIQSPSLS